MAGFRQDSPEPNGYLHVGHAKSICLILVLLRSLADCVTCFDDTNPETESVEFVNSIRHDIEWLREGAVY